MNQRETLAENAEAYIHGREDGFQHGREIERRYIARVEWLKLFGLIVAGTAIGCAITLGAAFAISFLWT